MRRPKPTAGQSDRPIAHGWLRARAVGLVLLSLGAQAGCGREFFRQWADQDATEAIFEKSRDPRWRLDAFSIEPPSTSRFANPYDPDRPPEPPDDYAASRLSPTPQWTQHKLLVPQEGTGYLDMLDRWQADEVYEPPTVPATAAPAAPPPTSSPSPFKPGENSGPGDAPLTPTPTPEDADAPTQARVGARAKADRDTSLALAAALRETKLPPPSPDGRASISLLLAQAAPPAPRPVPEAPRTPIVPTPSQNSLIRPEAADAFPPVSPALSPPETAADRPTVQPADGLVAPRIPLDPNPIDSNLARPVDPRPDQTPGEFRESESASTDMAGILIPDAIELDEAEASGLPKGSRPYRVTMEQAFALALINSRAYQFNLENVYISSLAVTLQRFSFEPQFVAGLSPQTTPGGLTTNPGNVFTYRTREAPGGQVSTLSLGQVAGFGKLFITGGRLLGSFASQTVFNFVGTNPRQPTVMSQLPLSFVQPFLRGGGRAVTLEALTQAERTLLYQIRLFARFRQEFIANIIVGGAVTNPGLGDPAIGFLTVLQRLQAVDIDRRNIAAFANYLAVYTELAGGESSGISQLQVDQVDTSLQSARQSLAQNLLSYQNGLDQFKQQIGLPPDVPLVLNRSLIRDFADVFDELDQWSRNPRRELEDLPNIIRKLPELQDIVIDGRSVIGLVEDTDKLEDLLLAGERVALENRLDLMNANAQLYDSWRQVAVTANGLKGILNVAVTNQIFTPSATSNPFAFSDQAKQFQLVLNAELPLIRVAERNAFRTSMINLQRQQRALQNAQDSIKFQIRSTIRGLHAQYQTYKIQQRNLDLSVRQKDQTQEQIIAPPASGGGSQANSGALQTNNLTQSQSRVAQFQLSLIQSWVNYQTLRISLYRDLGILPYDEWEAFYELYPAKPAGGRAEARPAAVPVRRGPEGAAAPAAGGGPAEEAARP